MTDSRNLDVNFSWQRSIPPDQARRSKDGSVYYSFDGAYVRAVSDLAVMTVPCDIGVASAGTDVDALDIALSNTMPAGREESRRDDQVLVLHTLARTVVQKLGCPGDPLSSKPVLTPYATHWDAVHAKR
ncbi:hypothetical protein [Streptomyces sp. SP18CS02]|uniref:hypothetical protein n=1 Tax=Streptomyces sp. SP18CS02 TaxID=3002531 RepID=UPI002E780EB1|nr:hypothetical protein [Streptomyces sp. SP18CS02]MEE1752262.1 hypothetical protein [Streptomyces sp. SP18CS02]